MSGRHRHHSRERGHREDHTDNRERRRYSRSASPPRRRSHSRSQGDVGSSNAAGRVERPRSPRGQHEHARSRDKRRSRSRSGSRDRERKRHKARRRSRSHSSSYDSDKRRRKKEKKKKKKEKQKTKAAISAAEWGKYGIIGEIDMRDKDPEFRTWVIEEKKLNPETSSDDQLKKLFKEFAEDYNTATLKHEKYYDMDAYQRRMSLVRSGESNLLEGLDTYDPRVDVIAHTKGLKRAPRENESFLSRDELEELRKVKLERDQIGKMKLLGMNIDSKTGVRMDTAYE